MINELGIYEKALPKGSLKDKLNVAKSKKFAFMELSIDESDERLARIEWSDDEIENVYRLTLETGVKIRSICFSGQRRYPLGSHDSLVRMKSVELLKKVIVLASKLNVRVIQLAGYDVFYEEKSVETKKWFVENLNDCLKCANAYGVMLAIEIMDDMFINSIDKYLQIKKLCPSPWLAVYPDLGNLSAWCHDDTINQLKKGLSEIVALHIKDTMAVSVTSSGKFKNVKFGTGCVNFYQIFRFLKDVDFTGPMMIEAWCEEQDHSLENLDEALEFVRQKFKEAKW